jgi:hypothetical protein
MAPPASMQHKVRLLENEEVACALHKKRLAMRDQPAGFKEHLDHTFDKVYHTVCDSHGANPGPEGVLQYQVRQMSSSYLSIFFCTLLG